MRLRINRLVVVVCALQAAVCVAQAQTAGPALKIPPVKLSLVLDKQPVDVSVWGRVAAGPPGAFRLAVTVDLADFQQKLTPILAAQLDRSERCGERLAVEKATLVPVAPSGLLTATVHYERFACAKVLGKEVVKRVVGGNAVAEVNLTPSVVENGIVLAAQVEKIEADGSLGEVLRSGSFGDSIRTKVAASIENAVRKSANLKDALPAALENNATLEAVQFADGGDGHLWLTLDGAVQLSREQFNGLSKLLPH
jgi:hypothetical protein